MQLIFKYICSIIYRQLVAPLSSCTHWICTYTTNRTMHCTACRTVSLLCHHTIHTRVTVHRARQTGWERLQLKPIWVSAITAARSNPSTRNERMCVWALVITTHCQVSPHYSQRVSDICKLCLCTCWIICFTYALTPTYSGMYSLLLSLSLSHTHTDRHTHTLSLSLSFPLTLTLSSSPSLHFLPCLK